MHAYYIYVCARTHAIHHTVLSPRIICTIAGVDSECYGIGALTELYERTLLYIIIIQHRTLEQDCTLEQDRTLEQDHTLE